MPDPLPTPEHERLANLQAYGILDTAPEQVFDDLAELAAQICSTPIAMISLVDADRQWFKARVGMPLLETARNASFCTHAIAAGPDLMIVTDAHADPRFADGPLVTGESLRFYAGAPLISPEGHALGTLCVADVLPREITSSQQRALRALARQVMTQLALRRRGQELHQANELIREHERLDRALRASEHRWRTIFATEPECVKLVGREGELLDMNPAGLAMIEAESLEQVAGCCVYDLVDPQHRSSFRTLHERVFLGESGMLTFEITGLKGTRRWMETRSVPMRDDAGRVTGSLSVTRDITGRKHSEDALRSADQDRAKLIDAIDGIVWEANAETLEFLFVSHQAERLLGYPIAQWLTEPSFWSSHLHPDDRVWAVDSCVASTQARLGHVLEYRMIAANGDVVWLHDIVRIVEAGDGELKLQGLMVDVTERRTAEDALRASSERNARQRTAIIELTRSPVLQAVDLEAALRIITETAARTLGVERVSIWRFNQSRSAIVCRDLFELTAERHSSGTALARETYPAYFSAISTSEVMSVDDALTDPRTCELAAGYLRPLGIASMLDAVIQVDGEIDGVLCHQHVGHVRAWTPDELTFVVSIANLVSLAIAQSERRQMEQRFRQSQKMEAFGQLAGGVAHDFNNILAGVVLAANEAAEVEGLPDTVKDALNEIEVATTRGASLTRQLLAFSRRQVMQRKQMDLNTVVTSLTQMLRRILGADVDVEVNLHPSPLLTLADAGMVDQVLMNLAVNARDAMPNGGRLLIETAERTIDSDEARSMADTAPGRYVSLRVTDSGCGISPEHMQRLFEPFFTTKEPGKGTGLGLATVFGIVKQHRGVVNVFSHPGRGATFSVLFPASGRAVSASEPPATITRRGGGETILVAEDEPAVRKLTRIVLQRRGYRVLEAASGDEALRIWEQHGNVDMLLTDLVMPGGMTGRELALRLQQRDANLKVIFTSGYSAELAGRDLALQEGENFLQKPCPASRIVDAVWRCLNDG
ncbi:MAG: putative Hybrid sensor histidine kinase [Myxococcales bacterium]|nr:putative Hybrid sensor histidine kinase [Myxococcales bacterium]